MLAITIITHLLIVAGATAFFIRLSYFCDRTEKGVNAPYAESFFGIMTALGIIAAITTLAWGLLAVPASLDKYPAAIPFYDAVNAIPALIIAMTSFGRAYGDAPNICRTYKTNKTNAVAYVLWVLTLLAAAVSAIEALR